MDQRGIVGVVHRVERVLVGALELRKVVLVLILELFWIKFDYYRIVG